MQLIRFLLALLVLQVAASAGSLDRESVDRDATSSGFVNTDSPSAPAQGEPSFLQRLTRI